MTFLKNTHTILQRKINLFLLVSSISLFNACNINNTSNQTYDQFMPSIEYRNGARPSDNKSKEYISELEKVPDHIQAIIEQEGSYFVFFNGPITDNKEMTHLKGVVPTGWEEHTWDELVAGQDTINGAILLGIKGDYLPSQKPTLHEYGHAYDQFVGQYLFNKNLSKTELVLAAVKTQPFNNSYFSRPEEYIANCVDYFYDSPENRKSLEYHQPTMHNFLSALEDKLLSEQK